jgi:hypothetical protein
MRCCRRRHLDEDRGKSGRSAEGTLGGDGRRASKGSSPSPASCVPPPADSSSIRTISITALPPGASPWLRRRCARRLRRGSLRSHSRTGRRQFTSRPGFLHLEQQSRLGGVAWGWDTRFWTVAPCADDPRKVGGGIDRGWLPQLRQVQGHPAASFWEIFGRRSVIPSIELMLFAYPTGFEPVLPP